MKLTDLSYLIKSVIEYTDSNPDGTKPVALENKLSESKVVQIGRNEVIGHLFTSGSQININQKLDLTMSVNIARKHSFISNLDSTKQFYAAILMGMDTENGYTPDFFSKEYVNSLFGFTDSSDVHVKEVHKDIKHNTISITFNKGGTEIFNRMCSEIDFDKGNDYTNNEACSVKEDSVVTIPLIMYYEYIGTKVLNYLKTCGQKDVQLVINKYSDNVKTSIANCVSNKAQLTIEKSTDVLVDIEQENKSNASIGLGHDFKFGADGKISNIEDKSVSATNDINNAQTAYNSSANEAKIDFDEIENAIAEVRASVGQSGTQKKTKDNDVKTALMDKSQMIKNMVILICALLLFIGAYFTWSIMFDGLEEVTGGVFDWMND